MAIIIYPQSSIDFRSTRVYLALACSVTADRKMLDERINIVEIHSETSNKLDADCYELQ